MAQNKWSITRLGRRRKIQVKDLGYVVVDREDYCSLPERRWKARRVYAKCNFTRNKTAFMHRLIMDAKPDELVDHVNRNPLDNRRCNLRIATNALNQQNSKPRKGSSAYKGVSFMKAKGKYLVAFRFDGQYHYVGYFKDERDAAQAYNDRLRQVAADKIEFCFLNPA